MSATLAPVSLPLACAFLCSYAYDKDRLPPSRFRPECHYAWKWPRVHRDLSDWKRFSCADSDAQALFSYREPDRTAFVAFRGTDSLRDGLLDAAIAKRSLPFMADTDPDARVHAGFFRQYQATVVAVREYLARHPDRSRVVVTGHSLGAAVATLCAALLRDELDEPRVACHVFGCPRVGNTAFANRVDAILELRRFVVGHDPVACLPTRVRWKHAGRRVWYVNGARVRGEAGDPWYNAGALPNLFRMGDHAMPSYIDCVAADEACRTDDAGAACAGCSLMQAGADGVYMTGMAVMGLAAAWAAWRG
eukprot:jgi/Tetstr1/454035/TSEL_040954.t1